MNLLDGHQNIGEGGFTYSEVRIIFYYCSVTLMILLQTVPSQDMSSSSILPLHDDCASEDSTHHDKRSEYTFETYSDGVEIVESGCNQEVCLKSFQN